jgi:hypothetical protein
MKRGRSIICMIGAAALSIGTAVAGEDSSHRFQGTGPEWHEVTSALVFEDADSEPGSTMAPDASVRAYEQYDYPWSHYDYPA